LVHVTWRWPWLFVASEISALLTILATTICTVKILLVAATKVKVV
jgi:hypothetical protein